MPFRTKCTYGSMNMYLIWFYICIYLELDTLSEYTCFYRVVLPQYSLYGLKQMRNSDSLKSFAVCEKQPCWSYQMGIPLWRGEKKNSADGYIFYEICLFILYECCIYTPASNERWERRCGEFHDYFLNMSVLVVEGQFWLGTDLKSCLFTSPQVGPCRL